MMKEIEVSIIVPVFNASETIGDLISKICDERRLNFELIIINDGSTDSTKEIVSSFKDERVILINQENSGVYAARNAGLKAHKGKWLVFLDADDEVRDGFIYDRYQLAEQQNIDVLVMNAWRDGFGHSQKIPIHDKQPYNRKIKGLAWIEHCVTSDEWPHYLWLQMVKSEYINNNKIIFHQGKSHKDILWTMELALCDGGFYVSNEKDYTYLHNAQSITNRGDYYDVRAVSYIDVIKRIIGYSTESKYKCVKRFLLRHALVETKHFLGLYRNRVMDKKNIKIVFKTNISLLDLFMGIGSVSDFFFFIKLSFKMR